tara:strand:- start:148 stop:1617 length:1470 start_codon:yes stop_codon:yes gene_type:complete
MLQIHYSIKGKNMYNTQGVTGGDPRNLGGSEGYGNSSPKPSGGLGSQPTSASSTSNDEVDDKSIFETIASLFSNSGATLPPEAPNSPNRFRDTSGDSIYTAPAFTGSNNTSQDNSTSTAVDDALNEALGIVELPEIYLGQMGPEEPEPNINMDVLQGALQPEPITVEEIDVKAGDTLSAIAKDKGVPLQDVIDANPQIGNPDLIRPGEKVTIPSILSDAGKLFMAATDPQAPAPVSEDPDRKFYQSGVDIEDRVFDGTDPRNLGGAEGYGSVGTPPAADSGLMSKPYDAESMKAINDDMMVGPSVVIAPNVDFDFIKEREGYKNSMYVPKDKKKKVLGKSGPTIASGFDVGQRSLSDLKGLPATLVVKLEPYLGMKGAAADAYVTANELTLTSEEIDTINKFSKKQEINRLKEDWEGSTSTLGFDDLTEAQATVVASVAFQYGNLPTKAPTFWEHVTNGDWDKAEAELRAFGDKYPTRRTAEADFLAGN